MLARMGGMAVAFPSNPSTGELACASLVLRDARKSKKAGEERRDEAEGARSEVVGLEKRIICMMV